jgi:Lon protease-like protein
VTEVTDTETLPMFPLGTVLFPSMLLPLRVFEPRYREMMRVCLDGDGRFGVVMIERGSEVGGGDTRASIGTAASIVQAQELPDGQWRLLALGTSRFRVDEWLPDDPFPQARVASWCDGPIDDGLTDVVARIERRFRTAVALAGELDEWSVPATMELDPEPLVALYQMCAASPLGPFDRQRLLAAETCHERAADLEVLLDDLTVVLRDRLGGS